MFELMGQPFDSTWLDKMLMGIPLPNKFSTSELSFLVFFLAVKDDPIKEIKGIAKQFMRLPQSTKPTK